jgi:glycosyltransferase involved in cell wall biosynthesis
LENISVVIPVHNEQDSIKQLHEEILINLHEKFDKFEVIYVNDGSTDETGIVLSQLRNARVITLKQNRGQTKAMQIGIKVSKYEAIAFLDGDGQNDPADIYGLYLRLISSEIDAVCGWRKERQDKFSKKFLSRGAAVIKNILIPDGIHDSGCTLKVMNSDAAKSLNLRGELHRFIPSLLVMQGYKVEEMIVNHRPRKFGVTKYNWKRVIKGYLDMLSLWFWGRYSSRPMHFFGVVSLASICLALVFFMGSLISYLFLQGVFKNLLLLASFFSVMSAIQILLIGLIAEFFANHFAGTKEDKFEERID